MPSRSVPRAPAGVPRCLLALVTLLCSGAASERSGTTRAAAIPSWAAGPGGTLAGRYTPTVRHPVAHLPGGGLALGVADVVVANDPVTGQGSNAAAKCAAVYLAAILEHGEKEFDEAWMRAKGHRHRERAPRRGPRHPRPVDRGGPHPYAEDGTVIGTFERALPRHERGYCREYTVPAPVR